ncbi:methylated-DNA--[protein]-cysteine S-methyltransferase [Paracoccus laeviglucosivorans]|uniref:methylated-DNA--[protein]-cysteine S-methyltransferase n=1 Tax=Paracoccus laeviglucosivorans TaxID=1197861 RepID=A0A521CHG9_9RHOB|nr:methylated-DNA--[protein]-cysteine S-methyltransferase [Paracoccus laeviglucosivorans]SMO58874.1 AraC family transcriptional regulator, regulatory protein of adaptative response / methylated-DNA-[protein]-cysteine methyltransferase [Paracoccus laeviglucosivorans]
MTQIAMSFGETGPSGLNVTVTAMPGDDAGAVLCHGTFPSPIGTLVALGADGALWGLGIAGDMTPAKVLTDLAIRWPRARLVDNPKALTPAIDTLLTGHGDVTVRLVGTEFQMLVWRALLNIPLGELISYAGLAQRIGRPKALRAIGTAVGQNPVSWIVPCHRVTRSGGGIGGYHWGEAVKHALLTREGASIAPRPIAAM